jgi:hypothetical protein
VHAERGVPHGADSDELVRGTAGYAPLFGDGLKHDVIDFREGRNGGDDDAGASAVFREGFAGGVRRDFVGVLVRMPGGDGIERAGC